MKPTRVKPIRYVKSNAADLIRELNEHVEPLVITQKGDDSDLLDPASSEG